MGGPAALGGALILAADGLYLFLIGQQGAGDGTLRVPFVASFLAICGVCAVLGAVTSSPGPRLALVVFGTAGALIWGFLGIFSVGPLLIVSTIPLGIAVARQQALLKRYRAPVAAAAGVALAVTIVGMQLTS